MTPNSNPKSQNIKYSTAFFRTIDLESFVSSTITWQLNLFIIKSIVNSYALDVDNKLVTRELKVSKEKKHELLDLHVKYNTPLPYTTKYQNTYHINPLTILLSKTCSRLLSISTNIHYVHLAKKKKKKRKENNIHYLPHIYGEWFPC